MRVFNLQNMTYDSYEEMLEDRATNPRLIVCPTCDGLMGQWRYSKIGQWVEGKWVSHETERWVVCSSCNGTGHVTPRQFDQV